MQIGTRWKVGAEPPSRLPAAVKQAITETEADLQPLGTDRRRWTLTWLENRPVVELDPGPGPGSGSWQPGTTIRMGSDGSVTVSREGDEEEAD